MNKLCAFLKKFNGVIGVVAFALVAVYGLIMATPTAICLKPFSDFEDQGASINNFYEQFMFMNNAFLVLAIFGVVWALLYKTLRNDIRKVYYISNFVWHAVFVIYCLAVGIYVIVGVAQYNSAYAALPFDEMNAILEKNGETGRIDPNTPIFLIGYLVGFIVILSGACAAFICTKQFIARLKNSKKVTDEPVEELSVGEEAQ